MQKTKIYHSLFMSLSNVNPTYIIYVFINFSLVDASSGAHAYGAEANASSASNVDELHQEISVRSAVVIIPLIIVWTHTHIRWSIFKKIQRGCTREEDVAGKATSQNE